MKMNRLLILLIALTLAACTNDAPSVPSTAVTMSLGSNIGIRAVTGVIPPNIQSMSVIAKDATGTVIAGPVTASRPSLTVTILVPNGDGIRLILSAFNAAGDKIYKGVSAPQSLVGAPVSVSVKLNLVVGITANVLSVPRGGVVNLAATVMGVAPPASSPVLWTSTAGVLGAAGVNGVSNTWTAPATLGPQTIFARVDPTVNLDQDAGFSSSIVIHVVNRVPVAVKDVAITAEDTPVITVNVLANDTDADGDVLSVLTANAVSTQGGTVLNNNNGTFTYTPALNFFGTDTFNYAVSDGQGGSAVGTVTITVTPVNDAPVPTASAINTTEGVNGATTVLANDPDALDTHTYAVTTFAFNGEALVNATTGVVNYIPQFFFNGTDSFVITVTDAGGLTGTITVNVNVTAVNNAPVFTVAPSIVQAAPTVGTVLTLAGTATTDVDSAPATLSYQWQRAGVSIAGATAASYTLVAADLAKSITCVITADDGSGTVTATTVATTAPVTVLSIPVGTTHVWTGATNTLWSITTNWDVGTVPTATSNVFIPAAPVNQPRHTLAITLNDLTVAAGATATFRSPVTTTGLVTINGTVATPALGAIVTSGAQNLSGSGFIGKISVNSPATTTLVGPLNVGVLDVFGSLIVAGQTINATTLTTLSGGFVSTLIMNNISDVVNVSGNATFGGQTILTAGTLNLGGNLTASATVTSAFSASGTHTTILNGTVSQAIDIPIVGGALLGAQGFKNLQINNPAGVTVTNQTYIDGNLDILGTTAISFPGVGFSVRGNFSQATGTSFTGGSLRFGGAFNFAAGATFTATSFVLDNATVTPQILPAPGGTITYGTLITRGAVQLSAAMTLAGLDVLALSSIDLNGFPLTINGQLRNQSGALATFTGTGQTVTTHDVASNINGGGFVFDNVLLNLAGPTTITTALNDLTFQNYIATATPLQFAVSNWTGTLNNLTFSSPLTSGSHIGGIGIGNNITIASTNVTGTTATAFALANTVTWSTPSPLGTTHRWTGATSTAWNVTTNWDVGTVPGAASVVFIPAAPVNQPTVSAATSITGFVNEATSILTITGGITFTVANTFTNQGIIDLNSIGAISNNLVATTALNNTGTIVTTGTSALDDTITGAIVNTGVIDLQTRGLILANAGKVFDTSAASTINVPFLKRLTITGGTMRVGTGTTFGAGGSLIYLDGAILDVASDFTIPVAKKFTFAGVSSISGVGVFSNSGTMSIDTTFSNGTLNIATGFINSGTIDLITTTSFVPTLNVTAGAITNVGFIKASGPIAGSLINAAVVNVGTINVNAGLTISGLFSSSAGGSFVNGVGFGLQLNGGVDVDGMTVTNMPLIINNIAPTLFDNITLQNGGYPTVDVLNLNFNNATVTFNNLTFTNTPALTTGSHIAGTGTGNTITIASTNVTGTTAAVFNGVNTVNWPGAALPPGTTHAWTGATSAAWNVATNWDVGTVPGAASVVFIPAAPVNQPTLTAAASIKDIVVEIGAALNIAAFNFTVNGNVKSNGAVTGTTGSLTMFGANTTLQGTVPNLAIAATGSVSIVGTTVVTTGAATGNLTVFAGGILNINGQTLDVSGNFSSVVSTTTNGLIMQNVADIVRIKGNAIFDRAWNTTGSSAGSLSAGILHVGGNFTQKNQGPAFGGDPIWSSFVATGTHKVVFDGTVLQTINFTNPGTAFSRFSSVEIANNVGVSFTTNVTTTGQLTITAANAATLTSTGLTLTVGDVNVDGATFDNLILASSGATKFDNATFQNYANTATPLSLNFSNVTATFNNLNYNTALTTGFHIGGTGTGNTITVASTNANGTTAVTFSTVTWPNRTIISTGKGNNTITTPTTWTLAGSPYWVQSAVAVNNGGTLTIDAGVVVKFNNAKGLTVNVGGTLNMPGTALNPVILTSVNDDVNGAVIAGSTGTPGSQGSGYWKHVFYNAGSFGNMANVRVLHGGNTTGAIYISGASPSLTDIFIGDSKTTGLYIDAWTGKTASPNITNLTIVNPVVNTVFTNGVYLRSVGTGIVTPSFTGVNSISGIASTSSAILLTSLNGGPVNPSVSGFTINGGRYSLWLDTGTSGTFTNNTFDGASTGGVYIADGATPTINNTNTISNTLHPYTLSARCAMPVGIAAVLGVGMDKSLSIVGTMTAGCTLTANPLGVGSQWLQTGTITIPTGVMMNIDPGVVFKVKTGTFSVNSGATLNINGVAGSPVIFTSSNDNNFGSPVNGSTGVPVMGEGLSLTYQAGSLGAISFMNDSYGSSTNIKANITADNLTIFDSQFGLKLLGTPAISNLTIDHWGAGGGAALTIDGLVSNASPIFTGTNIVNKFTATHEAVTVKGINANPTFAGFTIDLQGLNQPALLVTSSATGTYSNNTFQNAGKCVAVYSNAAPIINNNIMRDCITGVSLGQFNNAFWQPGAATVTNNKVVNNTGSGIYVAGAATGLTIDHNLIRGNGTSGIFVDTLLPSDLSIRNNLIVENTTSATLSGVYIKGNGVSGPTVSLLGNTIANNTSLGVATAGLLIDSFTTVTANDNIMALNFRSDAIQEDLTLLAGGAGVFTNDYNLIEAPTLPAGVALGANSLSGLNSGGVLANWYAGAPVINVDATNPNGAVGVPYLTGHTFAEPTIADVGNLDLGYHHVAAAPTVDLATSTVVAAPSGTPLLDVITVTPKDVNGLQLGAGLLITATITQNGTTTGTIAPVRDMGDGTYEFIFTESNVPGGNDTIVITANGIILQTAVAITW